MSKVCLFVCLFVFVFFFSCFVVVFFCWFLLLLFFFLKFAYRAYFSPPPLFFFFNWETWTGKSNYETWVSECIHLYPMCCIIPCWFDFLWILLSHLCALYIEWSFLLFWSFSLSDNGLLTAAESMYNHYNYIIV